MSNLIIYTNDNKIRYFIKDCIRIGNNFYGSNRKLIGLKINYFNFKWTDDDINEFYDENNSVIGYDKDVDQLTMSPNNFHLDKITHIEYIESIKIRKTLSNFDYQQIEQYIDNNVSDINSAKEILKIFGKVILSLCKQIDYNI